ncbi:MAG: hypothetical protein V3W18_01305 [candidate division Zixibacteria bacterium]
MNLKLVDRIIKSTLIAAAVLFPFLTFYTSINFGLSVLFGAIWGALNLFAIKFVITSLVTKQTRKPMIGAAVLIFKIPVLYGIGYLLVTWDYLSVGGLVWGFSGILITAFFNALSRSLLGLDNNVNAGKSKA